MRLFLAVRLSREAERLIEGVQDALRSQNVGGNYTPAENLHITLAFIGEYGDPDRVLDLLDRISFDPFSVTFDRAGRFDGVWWIGVSENLALEAVARRVRRVLAEGGVPFDRKRFVPHVTVLRKPEYPPGAVPAVSVKPTEMTVRRVSLMQSVRGKNGMLYRELGAIESRRG